MTHWTAIIPVKRIALAKQRLEVPPPVRRSLAEAFAQDVITVALETPGIDQVVVVTSDSSVRSFARRHGADVVSDPLLAGADRLNASIRRGATWAERRNSDARVVVLPADLPSVDVPSLRQVLTDAADLGRSFVADKEGDGTTLLMAASPGLLIPAYGPGSASLHRQAGYVGLTPVSPRLRRDVDGLGALREAIDLGVGEHSFSALHVLAASASADHRLQRAFISGDRL